MESHNLSAESTFYQFTLVKKIHYVRHFIYAYLCIPGLTLVFLIKVYSILGFLIMIGECIFVVILHTVMLFVLLKVRLNFKISGWSFQFLMPWIGYLPKQYVSLSLLKRAHNHLFWVGLVIMGFLSPWSSFYLVSTLCLLHLWILMPRFIIFYLLRTENPTGVIKLNRDDTSYYIL